MGQWIQMLVQIEWLKRKIYKFRKTLYTFILLNSINYVNIFKERLRRAANECVKLNANLIWFMFACSDANSYELLSETMFCFQIDWKWIRILFASVDQSFLCKYICWISDANIIKRFVEHRVYTVYNALNIISGVNKCHLTPFLKRIYNDAKSAVLSVCVMYRKSFLLKTDI